MTAKLIADEFSFNPKYRTHIAYKNKTLPEIQDLHRKNGNQSDISGLHWKEK